MALKMPASRLKKWKVFGKLWKREGIEHTITVYPGVGHAFVHYDTLMQPGAAQDAWNQMLAFFEQALGG